MSDFRPDHAYDLVRDRQHGSAQVPFSHQNQALDDIRKWFDAKREASAGCIVVLPTGGGKTFTAIRFLCTTVIPKGYKVLWLAHTHHLLDQAFLAFARSVAAIPEPRSRLVTRVVSGTPGHHPVHRIEPTDDVVVATLQSTTLAFENRHPSLLGFLKAAGERLCVVFDEAHHAPAPSYRKLLKALRTDHAKMALIGLTATPTYGDPRKQGWLRELFPQGIVHQSTARVLMADGILSRPNFEKVPTSITPDFDEREYRKWVDTYRDLPEDVIKALAENRERNSLIADHYVRNRERYGRSIIFAERWHQCEQIASFLQRQGVRAGSVYSRVDAPLATPDARNARTADDNRRTLEAFRNGDLDVLLNVKMLTEGTDVPQTQTVFVTRQTTSTILLTQMVGRALRGPKAGGTKEAYIVSFEDNWKHKINWAGFEQIGVGPIDEGEKPYGKRAPVALISIDLVRRLSDQMDRGENVTPVEFLRLMPVGWYRVEFQALVEGSEDVEVVRQLIMVFDDQVEGYRQFLEHLRSSDLSGLSSERTTLDETVELLDPAAERYFPSSGDEISRVDRKDLFHALRHVAQNEGELPQFFPFEERECYDLDGLAQGHLRDGLNLLSVNQALKFEYQRRDRFWAALYPRFELFKTQYDACLNRILNGPPRPTPTLPPPPPTGGQDREVSTAVADQVKRRDQNRCLCCGEANARRLQIDHIAPWYFGGSNALENLQTLCKACNQAKGITSVNFRAHRDQGRVVSPGSLMALNFPPKGEEGDPDRWAQCLQRAVNFFYNAAAVEGWRLAGRGGLFTNGRSNFTKGMTPSGWPLTSPTCWPKSAACGRPQASRGPKAFGSRAPRDKGSITSSRTSPIRVVCGSPAFPTGPSVD